VVILGGDNDEAVGSVDGAAQSSHRLIGVDRALVQGQRVVPEVQDLEREVVTATEPVHQPGDRFLREPTRSGGPYDRLYEWRHQV
jgi:hypothetical protein